MRDSVQPNAALQIAACLGAVPPQGQTRGALLTEAVGHPPRGCLRGSAPPSGISRSLALPRGPRLPSQQTWASSRASPARWASAHAGIFLACRPSPPPLSGDTLAGLQVSAGHARFSDAPVRAHPSRAPTSLTPFLLVGIFLPGPETQFRLSKAKGGNLLVLNPNLEASSVLNST